MRFVLQSLQGKVFEIFEINVNFIALSRYLGFSFFLVKQAPCTLIEESTEDDETKIQEE